MSKYFNKLAVQDKDRYVSKLRELGFTTQSDPFLLFENSKSSESTREWVDDVTKWPTLEFPAIMNYLVKTPGPFTMDTMQAYRSLDAYNFFINGWVQTCLFRKGKKGMCIIAAKVTRSQAVTDTAHRAWIGLGHIDSVTAVVECAHCSCMAGLGEVCSHVAAILFKVESCGKLGLNKVACTSVPCAWNQNFVKKVEAVPLDAIDFQKPSRKRRLTQALGPHADNNEIPNDPSNLLKDLKECSPSAVIFSIVMPRKVDPKEAKLPLNYETLYKKEFASLTEKEVQELSDCRMTTLSASKEQCDFLEQSTRSQSKSGLWHKYRHGRITASNFHDVIHTAFDKPSPTVIKNVCHGKIFKTPATEWGIDNEVTALESYYNQTNVKHVNFTMSKSGFVLSEEHSFLGASPDSIVECDCCGRGVVEVKCPYKFRNDHPCEISDKSFFLSNHVIQDSDMCDNVLKHSHRHYTQVQAQMGICDLNYCDFVVYTTKGIHVERILFDCWLFSSMLKTVIPMFKQHILPEMLTRKILHKTQKENSAKKSSCS